MRISITFKFYVLVSVLLCGVVVVGAWGQRSQLPAVLDHVDDDTRAFLSHTLFHVGGQPVRVLFLIKMVLFFIFLDLASRLARWLIQRMARHNTRLDKHRVYMLSKAIAFSIYTVGILIAIHVERINLNTLVILGGTLGVGLGFGLQSLVSNFVAGAILLFEQPIRIGDRIEFGNKTGEVFRIGGRSSWIRTYDNAILIIPNNEFVSKEILNWTLSDPKIRVALQVAVEYESDLAMVI